MVNNNNKQKIHPIALDETWITSNWEGRVFSLILNLKIFNSQYAYEYFGEGPKEGGVLIFPEVGKGDDTQWLSALFHQVQWKFGAQKVKKQGPER